MKIVAPAGNKERLYAAIKAGAEEIYMGLKGFGARRAAENFTLEEFLEAIDYAHLRACRIFLTLNTMMMREEIEFLYRNLRTLYEHGLDAIIVQDLGLALYLHQNFPDLEIHGSTQLSVANHAEINVLKKLGFSRIVLPRELSFAEIKSIRKKTDMELEVFVSGALCISYSGNCYLSSFLGGRSGNRGMCAQPCRKKYENNKGDHSFFLSPKDQFFGKEEIEKLQEIGIDSIKVEGRMKEANYVFTTVQYYRNLMDGVETEEKSSSLFNRGYSKGYFYEKAVSIINPQFSSNLGEQIGIFQGKEVHLKKDVILGDGLSYLSRDYQVLGGSYVNRIYIRGVSEKQKRARQGECLILKDVPQGSAYLYRNFAKELRDQLEQEKQKTEKRKPIHLSCTAKLGQPLKIRLSTNNERNEDVHISVSSESTLEAAKQNATTREELLQKLSELGNTTFEIHSYEMELEHGLFLPLSWIKKLKREATEALSNTLLASYKRTAPEEWKLPWRENKNVEQLSFFFILKTEDQKKFLEEKGYTNFFFRSYDIAKEGELEKHDLGNPLCANLYQLFDNKNTSGLIANWNLNISNLYTAYFLENISSLDILLLSPEISFERLGRFGAIQQRKALLVYSRLRGMYLELDLSKGEDSTLQNQEGDCFTIKKNVLGHSEVYLPEALNILSKQERIRALGVEIAVLEFTEETREEMEEILKQIQTKKGPFRPYNYERGVY